MLSGLFFVIYFECIFCIIHIRHLLLPTLGSGALYIRPMIWAGLASGPPSGRNAEIRFCNRGLIGSETATFFFSTKIMLSLCIFNEKHPLPERHQANFFF